jgi:PAS domain S-box-containing protein
MFSAVVALQVVVALFSIDLLSSVRAYVTGESLYSKGQKDAQIHLLAYIESQRDEDYRRFHASLAEPLGDRMAREALQRPQPDLQRARQGFLQGGNHPEDIDGLVRAFRWFHRVPFMAKAIATWTEGDSVIEQMRGLVELVRQRAQERPLDPVEVRALRGRAIELNTRLTSLERRFSAELGAASRDTRWLLLGLNLALAAVLAATGLRFMQLSLRELRQSEMRLSRLVGTVAEGVVTLDAQQRVVLFNQAAERMFGVPADQAVGQPVDRFVPEARRGTYRRLLQRFAAGAAEVRIAGAASELTGLRAGGEVFPMEASLSRMRTEQGLLITVVLRDVSEQRAARREREAREALEASNRAKTEFLSRMSHELRTPLNAVLGFVQLLRLDRRHPLHEEQLARVRQIERAGGHLLALVNDVLDLSRVEAGEFTMSFEPVSLAAACDEAAAIVSQPAGESRVQVQIERPAHPDDEAAWVLADPVRLRQVLVNLLSNAIKYNRPGGHVALRWQRVGAQWELAVADDGVGMTGEQLARLYEPFNRLGAERTTVEGTGIGLVLSRHLVGLMGGRLAIDSARGRGTVARVALPHVPPPAGGSPAPYVPSQHGELEDGDRLDVLYAEDNEVNVELVRQVSALRPHVALRVASSGAAALRMARLQRPDLMLVDMHLGDMTGLELAHALQRDPATAGIRLVALSADALPEQIRLAMERGFEHYLTKPVDFRELLRVLDEA